MLLTASSFAARDINLEGQYSCKGTEVGSGSAFTCDMSIKRTGETYALSSTCNDGTSYSGVGLYDKTTQLFSNGFVNPKNADETGVAVAHVKADGSMTATWTYINKTEVGHSSCSRQQKQS